MTYLEQKLLPGFCFVKATDNIDDPSFFERLRDGKTFGALIRGAMNRFGCKGYFTLFSLKSIKELAKSAAGICSL
jgi:hypothetical protein